MNQLNFWCFLLNVNFSVFGIFFGYSWDDTFSEMRKFSVQGNIHSGLEEVYLSFNMIRTVNTHTFVDLSSLETLRMDDNAIERIERRSFMNLDRLKQLDLRGNRLRSISDEAFQNLPELEELDLAYNELTNFDFTWLDQVIAHLKK